MGMPAQQPYSAAFYRTVYSALHCCSPATNARDDAWCAGSHIVTHLKLVEKVRDTCSNSVCMS